MLTRTITLPATGAWLLTVPVASSQFFLSTYGNLELAVTDSDTLMPTVPRGHPIGMGLGTTRQIGDGAIWTRGAGVTVVVTD